MSTQAQHAPHSDKKSLHLIHRGIKESTLLGFIAVSIFLIISLISYSPNDPSWSHSLSDRLSDPILNMGGYFGANFADIFLYFFGYMAYLWPIFIAYIGWNIYQQFHQSNKSKSSWYHSLRIIGFFLTLLSTCALSTLYFSHYSATFPANIGGGGIVGETLAQWIQHGFSQVGSTLIFITLFLVGITLFCHFSWLWLMDQTGALLLKAMASAKQKIITYWQQYRAVAKEKQLAKQLAKQDIDEANGHQNISHSSETSSQLFETDEQDDWQNHKVEPHFPQSMQSFEGVDEHYVEIKHDTHANKQTGPSDQPLTVDMIEENTSQMKNNTAKSAQLPQLDLLERPMPSPAKVTREQLEMQSRRIEEKLADYNMVVEVVAVQQGPVITLFELELAPGIKVSQLSNLAKDLARALLVVSIRVVEVIAGKSTVGIEIPNEYREIVSFYNVLNSKAYVNTKHILPLGLGHDISGQPVVAELAKMPHLLVAGTTGSGKSVGVNSMILSMLFNCSADELRMIMVDPKMLELSVYEGIPHLLCPVVTDMMEAANALRWCVAEMERRYRLLSALGVRNIKGYNEKINQAIEQGEPILDPLFEPNPMAASLRPDPLEPLPYIVIVIDEFADMMMVVGKKVEELIARLAQKARAAGMHLIIATQRPSVNVITGLIKANIPTRIAFQVSSKVDSRTILDQMGAEALLGNGDMLFLPPGTAMPQRIHGAFVDDHEVHAVVNELKSNGEAEYIEDILQTSDDSMNPNTNSNASSGERETDLLYDQAVAIVLETRKASASGLQRRLQVGYNRAARMVEDMEAAGLVTPIQSNGQRQVVVPANN